MSDSSPIFIGGAGRSGTTLVVDMLGLHPRISPIYETDFVLQLFDLFFTDKQLPREVVTGLIRQLMEDWTRDLPMRPHNKRAYERYHHGPHYILFDRAFALRQTTDFIGAVNRGQVEAGLTRFLQALFQEHCRQDGKPVWANKTPAYVQWLPVIRRLFPTMRFIHRIRDGRDVACSANSRPWGPRTFAEAADWWVSKVKVGVEFGTQYPDVYLELRYEDLVRSPSDALARTFAWLGEEACPELILTRYQDGAIRLDEERIGEWRRTFSTQDCDAFQARAGELLTRLGYY